LLQANTEIATLDPWVTSSSKRRINSNRAGFGKEGAMVLTPIIDPLNHGM
jgi:hypothetical protein